MRPDHGFALGEPRTRARTIADVPVVPSYPAAAGRRSHAAGAQAAWRPCIFPAKYRAAARPG